MQTTIISIGNSKGIRIPKVLLEESGIGEQVEIKAKKGEIRILASKKTKNINDTMLLSEKALATDWNKKEEDEAWENLR